MPFTPSILDENFTKYVKSKKNFCNKFMTLSYNSTRIAQKDLWLQFIQKIYDKTSND